ncbi:HK97 family phage prohead protease [Clostridium sp. CF012]|uniref:HK97 family phage prohead protease n=1 Tax=Clostridium sp. CF012 TaxID=2843319 RepID=UPI0028154A60|nr:HK97 family phage prohead protease [Clostridium sp. CF012]
MINIEVRENEVVIKGYINTVERDSREMPSPQGKFVEQVKTGTWTRALKSGKDISLLLNHDWNRKLGGTKEGNLTLREDNIGLYAEVRSADAEVIQKAKDNKLVGWSFGFNNIKDSWENAEGKTSRRFLEEIDLKEVSLLDNTRIPAYVGTSVESRDNKEIMTEERFIKDEIELINHAKEEKRELTEEEKTRKRILIELEL